MTPDSDRGDGPKTRPITDSPFFWLLLFVLVGSLGVVAISPKYAIRQSRIERRFEARQDVVERVSRGEEAPAAVEVQSDPIRQTQPRSSLAPLLLALAILAVIGAAGSSA